MRVTRVVVTTLCILACASPGLAQVATGTLSGRVTDGREALPGVTVMISSPSMQGTRVAVTEITGDYIFAFLPPGDYKVKFELQGFQTLDTSIKVSAAQTAKLDATMPQATVAEEVTVTGTYETISSSATASTTYESKLVNELPMNRDVANYVAMTPGVTVTSTVNAVSIGGAATYESLYLVNGVNVTENLRGQVIPAYIEEAIEETTTSISSVSAEYGRFTGGVVNALTKSGGNEFHGSIRDNMTNPKWTAPTEFTVSRTDEISNLYEGTLGGFVIRDRLWFFAAGRNFEQVTSNQTYRTDVPFDTTTKETRYEGKLTFSLTPEHRVIGSYTTRDRDWSNYFFPYVEIYDLDNIYNRSIPDRLTSFNYTGVLTENFFVEGQYSKRTLTFVGSGGSWTDLYKGTPIYDGSEGFQAAIYNSPIFCAVCPDANEERNSQEYLIKGSWFLTTGNLGSHDIRFGYNTYDDIIKSNNYQSGSNYFIDATSVFLVGSGASTRFYPQILNDGSSWIEYWPIFQYSRGTSFKTDSVFVNDTWRFNNNLSFNVGVRWDKNDGKDASGRKVVKDSKLSPRLAVTWDPKGDGDMIASVGYGRYVAAIANTVANSEASGGQPAYYNIFYGGPNINADGPTVETQAALKIVFDWLASIGGVLNNPSMWGPFSPNVPGYQTFIGKSLRSPSVDEYSLSFTKRLGSKGLLRADAINRKWADFYATRVDMSTGQVTDPNGIVYDKNVVENNSDILKRDYRALLLQGQYRLNERLNVGGNYTLSRTEGNFTGETGGSGPVTSGALSYPEYIDLKWNSPTGALPVDQTHRATLWAAWDVINTRYHSLNVSLMQQYFSGTPYGASSPNVLVADYVHNPGYETPPTTSTYWFTARDKYRTDAIISTNLGLTYAFKIPVVGTDLEIFVNPRVNNLFNRQGVINPNTTVYTSETRAFLSAFDPFTETPKECPQGSSSSTCSSMGANWQKGANFGKATSPTSFQLPRQFQINVGIRF